MQGKQLKGSIYERPNGTFTFMSEPIHDPNAGKKVRNSLGTFATRQEAEAEQVR